MTPAIHVAQVSKSFRQPKGSLPWQRTWKHALRDVSLRVDRGGVVAILGPNGSGKSSLVRILSTLLEPDAGSAAVFGYDVLRDAALVRAHINRVSVEAAFFKVMSPWENMLYAARLYGAAGADLRGRVETLLGRLGLQLDALDRPMKQLSRGQQQKVAIARSFLTSPNLLLMDEPTTGLDPRSKREVQEVLRGLRRERDVSVLLCTHDLDEAEELADRIVILDQGRVLADKTPDQLTAGGRTLEDVFFDLSGKSFEEAEDEELEEVMT
jgi:ABC-2 type transport system ATP-binding protein